MSFSPRPCEFCISCSIAGRSPRVSPIRTAPLCIGRCWGIWSRLALSAAESRSSYRNYETCFGISCKWLWFWTSHKRDRPSSSCWIPKNSPRKSWPFARQTRRHHRQEAPCIWRPSTNWRLNGCSRWGNWAVLMNPTAHSQKTFQPRTPAQIWDHSDLCWQHCFATSPSWARHTPWPVFLRDRLCFWDSVLWCVVRSGNIRSSLWCLRGTEYRSS